MAPFFRRRPERRTPLHGRAPPTNPFSQSRNPIPRHSPSARRPFEPVNTSLFLNRARSQIAKEKAPTRGRPLSLLKSFQRLARAREPEYAPEMEEQPSIGRREWRLLHPNENTRPLSRQQLRRDPIIGIGSERLERKELGRIEQMIIQNGYEKSISQIMQEHPVLGGILQHQDMFERFLRRYVTRPAWRKRLLEIKKYYSIKLFAVALLLYLRIAHVNKRSVREAIYYEMQSQQQQPYEKAA